MPETLTVRSRRVLTLTVPLTADLHWVTFAQADEDSGLASSALRMTQQSWVDLGSPRQVTVTIEPGDLLNT